MVACVSDNQSDLEMLGYIKTINIVGPDEIAFEQIGGLEQTKATSVNNGSALVFNWAVGDTLGIFPNKGNQVEFPITAQEGSTSASFDGGGWALRNNASYAAYYPFSVWNYFQNNKTVVMDYSGQVQNGNGSFEHLSAYDFLASAKTTPRNSTVTFQMDRQGSILYIDIVVPEPATITSLTISCNEAIFVEKAALDISGNTPVVTPIETKESLTLSFVNTTTTETNETVRAYMAVQPLDFSSKTVTATLITDADTYTAPVVSRVVNKGKAAFLRFSDSFTENGAQPNPEGVIPEAVDLGLPSGLKWASFNVGASVPEEYGDYFAWGEIEPKNEYSYSNYKWSDDSGNLLRYNNTHYSEELQTYIGDGKTQFVEYAYADDAARERLGGKWRMPSHAEFEELIYKCTWTWIKINGVYGYKVAGVNGNSIFLPAAGYRYGTDLINADPLNSEEINSVSSVGYYWTSERLSDYQSEAWRIAISNTTIWHWIPHIEGYYPSGDRFVGYSVRAVIGEGNPTSSVPVNNVSLDNSGLTLTMGETAILTATITPSNATQQSVTWLSSNTAVATVDSNGTVTAVDVGTTTITVTTNDGGLTATCEVTVNAEPVIPDDNDYINLSANETANCYIVSEAGSYSFDATIAGNGKCVEWDSNFASYAYPEYSVITGLKNFSGDGVEVVLNQNNCVSDVRYRDGKILFTATGAEGNAKLTLTNGGARVWTWVIWCTDVPTVLPFSRSGVTYHIMDRNIGAISDGSDSATCEEMSGLYYQFGNPIGYTWEEFNQGVCINRREEDMDGATATMKKALADNPNCPNLNCIGEPFSTGDYYWFWPYTTNTNGLYGNLWGAGDRQYNDNLKCGYENTKTLYDPCPAGYKVMGWDTFGWDTDAYYQVSYRDVNGLYIPVDGGANLFLPYNGAAWVNVSGEVFWMKKGPKLVYVYNPDDSVCATLWTSGHSGRNLAFCTVRFAVPWDGDDFDYDLYMSSGYGHIVSRGMGVRCIADEDFSGHAGIDNPSIYGGGHEVTSEEAWN